MTVIWILSDKVNLYNVGLMIFTIKTISLSVLRVAVLERVIAVYKLQKMT